MAARIQFIETCAQESWQSRHSQVLPEHTASAYLAHKTALEAKSLGEVLQTQGILRPASHQTNLEQRRWEFPHRSLQEYFAARAFVGELAKGYSKKLVVSLRDRFLEDPTSLMFPFVVGLLTREPFKNEAFAKQVCALIRPDETVITKKPMESASAHRVQKDTVWFKCLNEIPLTVLMGWEKAELLSWSWGDWSSITRLQSTVQSANLLQCEKFKKWAQAKEPKIFSNRWDSLSLDPISGMFALEEWIKIAPGEALKTVLEAQPQLLHSKFSDGQSILHLVTRFQTQEMLEWLVNQAPELLQEKDVADRTAGEVASKSSQSWFLARGIPGPRRSRGAHVLYGPAAGSAEVTNPSLS